MMRRLGSALEDFYRLLAERWRRKRLAHNAAASGGGPEQVQPQELDCLGVNR
jgi:hypothetical protein